MWSFRVIPIIFAGGLIILSTCSHHAAQTQTIPTDSISETASDPTAALISGAAIRPHLFKSRHGSTARELAFQASGAPGSSLTPAYNAHNLEQDTSSVQATLTRVANANLRANHFFFVDSTDGWTASPGLYDYSFAADTGITMVNYPDYFTPAQILNIAEKFIAAKNSAGEFPICLKKTGVPEGFYSAWDLLHHHATGDGAFYVPQMEYLYYKKSGSTSAFSKDAPAMKAALSAVPVNRATGMVQVLGNDQWVPWGFQDMVRKTGDDLMGSLLYYEAATEMAALYKTIGDSSNTSAFTAQANKIQKNLPELWDSANGMFYAATGQDKQIDIEGSAYAVYIGVATASQATAISTYLAKNYNNLTTRGYVRESPQDWALCYYIHGGTCHFTSGQYDNGAWSVANGWIAETLAKTNRPLAAKLITDFANSTDPTQEYWAWAGAAPPHSGQSSNLESPSGALSYAKENASLFHPQRTKTKYH